MQTNLLWTGREYYSLENCLVKVTAAGSEIISTIIGHYQETIYKVEYLCQNNNMRKLILEEWMSLDGHVSDKNNRLDFFTNLSSEENKYSDADQLKFLESIDTILLGRKTYELFVDFWPNATTDKEVIADKLNETKKIIFSNTITKAPWGKWLEAEVIQGDATEAIKKLKLLPGKDMVLWGSISLAQALIKENLIDEYHIQLCPVLTGGGKKLFLDQSDFNQLNLLEVRPYNTGTVFLNYGKTK
jgi:dihydrofolate reductase